MTIEEELLSLREENKILRDQLAQRDELIQQQQALLDEQKALLQHHDEQMNRLRAGMIEEVAQASPLEQADAEQQTRKCPQCGERMQARGKHQRRLQTHGGQQVRLTRQYLSCPACGYSFFPPR